MSGMPVGSAPNARTTHAVVRAGALALLAACGGAGGGDGGVGGTVVVRDGRPATACTQSGPPMPVVHIGPDATLHVLCGNSGSVAVASVDERGPGTTSWSVSVQGASANAFSFNQTSFKTCQALGPSVALLGFQVPRGTTSMPGDTFDAVVTVHADDGSFADGTVNVHVEVVVPAVIVDKTTLDFGDVLPGVRVEQVITFVANPGAPNAGVSVRPTPFPDPPFSALLLPAVQQQRNNVISWSISFESSVPGDFSASLAFSTAIVTTALPVCQWTKRISLHARVPDDAGVPDGGGDAGADGDER